MNPIIENLHARKSIRIFDDRPIPGDIKREILIAATQAPTAGNQQLYTILDIADQALKDRLAVTCDNQPFVAKAPLVLIFCADVEKWLDIYLEGGCFPRSPGPGDLMLAVSDANIAAQNAVTAAWSLGIGSCYIGDIMERCEEHRALLQLPERVFPAAMLVFGYPLAQQMRRKKPERCDLKHIVHKNAYRHMAGPELREMYAHKIGAHAFESWSHALCERKYHSDFSKEMNRSVNEYLRAFDGEKE